MKRNQLDENTKNNKWFWTGVILFIKSIVLIAITAVYIVLQHISNSTDTSNNDTRGDELESVSLKSSDSSNAKIYEELERLDLCCVDWNEHNIVIVQH